MATIIYEGANGAVTEKDVEIVEGEHAYIILRDDVEVRIPHHRVYRVESPREGGSERERPDHNGIRMLGGEKNS